MSKMCILLSCMLLALTACTSPESLKNTGDQGITNTKNHELLSDEELINNSRNEVVLNIENRRFTKEEAKALLKNHLNLSNHDKTDLSYEGIDGGEYVFHATDLVHFSNHPEKLSRGWYKVNSSTGKVSKWNK
ncbi:hypothetical protein FIU87_08010 [Bacillus sp. THAF10]|uniref:hypothetical protein n=1 Tax=Bacillus sp. THAF10 TaxID=2587848 RepID=UPI0012AAB64F|nr:hypothetical protein [Bacillus sp. THAF10]QFT88583.1 hypothetical protein FIU87_08010 [Bacillus sp. THAF10]